MGRLPLTPTPTPNPNPTPTPNPNPDPNPNPNPIPNPKQETMSRHPEFVSTDERVSSVGVHDSKGVERDSKALDGPTGMGSTRLATTKGETLLTSNCTKSKSVIWQYMPPKEGTIKRSSQEIAYMKTHCSKQPATAIKKSLGLIKAFR